MCGEGGKGRVGGYVIRQKFERESKNIRLIKKPTQNSKKYFIENCKVSIKFAHQGLMISYF